MLPEEIYKRRHFGTPESVSLIIINYIVTIIAIQTFAMRTCINSFFWVVIGLLAAYNAFRINRNRDSFDRKNVIAYSISLVLLLASFFLFRMRTQPC